jgi:flagellar biosynthesis GTPase FlhF
MFVKQNSNNNINYNNMNIPNNQNFFIDNANQTNNMYQNINNNMDMNFANNIGIKSNQINVVVPVGRVLANPEFNNQKITIQNVDDYNNDNNYNQNYNNKIIFNQPGVNIIKENNINDGKNSQKKKELIIKLNNFLNEENIQTKSLEKRSILNDPVFESIQKEEKKELIKIFNKGKFGFQNEILNYLNTQPIQFDQNLIFQIINYENGTQIYKNKMENRISKLRKDSKLFEINYLTIILLGKSGVGKTTLINKILNVNGKTGTGNFVTTDTTPYQSKVMPYLRLVDTRGIEVSANFGAEQLRNEVFNFIGQQNQTNNYNNFTHCI